MENDTPESLAARVLEKEHEIYPQALALVASGQSRFERPRVSAK
jgi:phosphoribosylglycinamide formyltransferase 1